MNCYVYMALPSLARPDMFMLYMSCMDYDRLSSHPASVHVHALCHPLYCVGTLDSSLSHPGSLVTPSAVESNLKANFEQYSYSHEDSGNQVKELIGA